MNKTDKIFFLMFGAMLFFILLDSLSGPNTGARGTQVLKKGQGYTQEEIVQLRANLGG